LNTHTFTDKEKRASEKAETLTFTCAECAAVVLQLFAVGAGIQSFDLSENAVPYLPPRFYEVLTVQLEGKSYLMEVAFGFVAFA
jgi:hypothetical protein